MSYELSLDKKKTTILLLGLVLLGILLFLGGVLIGYGYRPLSPPAARFAQNSSKLKLPQAAPAALAAQAVSFSNPVKSNPASAGPQPGGGQPAQVTASTPPPVPAPAGAAAAPDSSLAPATPGAHPAAISESPASAKGTNAGGKAYAIQMGLFQDPNNAARLVKSLKALGYDATIFKAPDQRGRMWDAVRIGRFSDFEDAIRAAAEIRVKAEMFALVRPANTL